MESHQWRIMIQVRRPWSPPYWPDAPQNRFLRLILKTTRGRFSFWIYHNNLWLCIMYILLYVPIVCTCSPVGQATRDVNPALLSKNTSCELFASSLVGSLSQLMPAGGEGWDLLCLFSFARLQMGHTDTGICGQHTAMHTYAYTGPWILLRTQIHEFHTWLSVRIWTRELIPRYRHAYTKSEGPCWEKR